MKSKLCQALCLAAAILLSGAAWAQTTPSTVVATPITPLEHQRGAEQTLLTFPEWFLVFSPNEYADYTQQHTPSDFPWWGHIGQFWSSYAAVTHETSRREMAPNPGYHLMIMVIGVSITVEYALRSAYESLIGRFASLGASQPTEEEQYGARVAREYVDFIRVLPWYEFDFTTRLRKLWTENAWWGASPWRKWERRFALTTEYAIKAMYGKLIKMGTKSVYEEPLLVTAVVLDRAPAPNADRPELKVLQPASESGAVLVTVPRYEAFSAYVKSLSAEGLNIQEIAGNRGFILVSLLAPRAWAPSEGLTTLFEQVILTQPDRKRVAVWVPVPGLAAAVRDWGAGGAQIEHVFDY